MENGKIKTYIWSIPTRAFHWLLVLFLVLVVISSQSENLLKVHTSFGYGVGVLIIFRIVWGIWGPLYSKFKEFPFRDIFSFNPINHRDSYPGHNPPASFVMVAIIFITLLTVFSGISLYGIQEGRGILAFLNREYFYLMDNIAEIHTILVYLLYFLIFLHLGGVIIDRFLNREERVLESIFTGYKMMDVKSTGLNPKHKIFASLFLTLSISISLLSLSDKTILTDSIYKPTDYKISNQNFFEECGSCHTLYPPFTLPKDSWSKIMGSLENHFGDDASLDEPTKEDIETFLLKNSANSSNRESAFYILKSLRDTNMTAVIAITETPYWRYKHRDIDKRVFKFREIKSKSNCTACHKQIEKGLIEDEGIEPPSDDS
jgi:cytochrome b